MKWMPCVEGEFVCSHLAPNLAYLVLVLTRHVKFYKTVITVLGKNGHNNTLLSYYSCKKCFDMIKSVKEIESNPDWVSKIDEPGKYRITGSIVNHSRGYVVHARIIFGSNRYLSVRGLINDDIGSGYKFSREKASEIWENACIMAFAVYTKSEDKFPHERWAEWRQNQGRANTTEKTWITKLARTKLAEAIDIMDNNGSPHAPFDPSSYFFEGKNKCTKCHVIFDGRGRDCRFCRKLAKSEIKQLEKLEKKIKKRLKIGDHDKKEALSNRIEDDGRDMVVEEMVEERGRNETFSDLKEMYGRKVAREMTGISEDESEDEEGLTQGEREEL